MKYKINDNELIYLIKENDEYSMKLLFNKYKPIVYKVCSTYFIKLKKYGIEFNDLIQEGYCALYKASCTFNFCYLLFYYYSSYFSYHCLY